MSVPIFVINMQGSEKRWKTLNNRLANIGISAERFPATIGKELTKEQLDEWYSPQNNKQKYHRDLTLGEIGCYVSHMRIWQKMVDEKINHCLVLEDDLFIEEHLISIIELSSSLHGWDLIKLSDNRDFPFIDSKSLQHNFTLGNYRKAPNGTQGYLISLPGAKKLLTRKPFCRPVDVDMQFHSEVGLQMLGIKPYPISEDRSFESDIVMANSGRHSSRSTFLRNLKYRTCMYLQRKVKTAELEKIMTEKET